MALQNANADSIWALTHANQPSSSQSPEASSSDTNTMMMMTGGVQAGVLPPPNPMGGPPPRADELMAEIDWVCVSCVFV